ncbi:MAG TPA: NAD(P)-dependent alcohol dehydrogenase [Thermoanaerobaculia bacterium]|nr:NAD(P)-dependent alcohol dehydrogenase [Thermoanaerobaculia bacterium]
MKAIVQEGYGLPGRVLALREIDTPEIDDRGVLVQVHASSVNALDWHITRGMPFLIRIGAGFRRPKPKDSVRGVDVSGRVAAVGKDVTRFKVGDEVFGASNGSFAEYATATEEQLALKPGGITHEQAASLNVAGLTALQGLRDKAKLQRGQHLLINGAGGGVGTFAVQIAKWLGARVTAVTRTRSVELVRSLGADDVIDHEVEDFTRRGERYDVIFDIGGNQPLNDCRRVLSGTGALVTVGAPAGRWIAPATRLLAAAALAPFVRQRVVPFISQSDSEGLALLAELTAGRIISPVIERTYELSDAPAAIQHVGEGSARGKVVIKVRSAAA